MLHLKTKEILQLTHSPEGESSAKWSPDGKFISFIASRNGDEYAQIWLLDRRGGEAKKLTNLNLVRSPVIRLSSGCKRTIIAKTKAGRIFVIIQSNNSNSKYSATPPRIQMKPTPMRS
jgi:Tol biopolymer transport system component